MSSVRTIFETQKRFHTPSGTGYENTYQEQIDKKTGRKILVKIGKTCVYDKIQEDLESSKIENIIHRLAMHDLSVLKEAAISYADADNFPKDLREAQDIVIRAKQEFEKFPIEVKRQFNNSPEQYVSEMGTQKFFDKMAPYNEKMAAAAKEKEASEYSAKVNAEAQYRKDVNTAMGGAENE